MYIYDNTSLNSSNNAKRFTQNLQIKLKHILWSIFFFPENRTLYEIVLKNTVERGRPQITIQYGGNPLHAGYLRQQTHTQSV